MRLQGRPRTVAASFKQPRRAEFILGSSEGMGNRTSRQWTPRRGRIPESLLNLARLHSTYFEQFGLALGWRRQASLAQYAPAPAWLESDGSVHVAQPTSLSPSTRPHPGLTSWRDPGGSGVVQVVPTREAAMDPHAIRVPIRAKLGDGRLPRDSAPKGAWTSRQRGEVRRLRRDPQDHRTHAGSLSADEGHEDRSFPWRLLRNLE